MKLQEFADMADTLNLIDKTLFDLELEVPTLELAEEVQRFRRFFISPFSLRRFRIGQTPGGSAEAARLLLLKWERLQEEFPRVAQEVSSSAFDMVGLETARRILLRINPQALIPDLPGRNEFIRGGQLTLRVEITFEVPGPLGAFVREDPRWKEEVRRLREAIRDFPVGEVVSPEFRAIISAANENLRRIARERGADAEVFVNAGSVQTVRIKLPPPQP